MKAWFPPPERTPGRYFLAIALNVATLMLLRTPSCADDRAAPTPPSKPGHRVALRAGLAAAIMRLSQSRPEKPAPLFLITDPNKDPDDLNVLIDLKALEAMGFVDIRCVVSTLGNRDVRATRAHFARSVLDDLGLKHARVGVGVDYALEVKDAQGGVDLKATRGRESDHRIFVDTPLLKHTAVIDTDGQALLKRELMGAPDHSAVILVNAGMADIAAILRDAPDLVKQKAGKVVIMGGVKPQLDERHFVLADERAYNNTTHQPSANFTYARVQELGLPLVIVTREATYSAAVPRSFYDEIAATGNPIGVYLKKQQFRALEHLWEGVNEGRLGKALTPEWFFKTFTDADLESAPGKEAIAKAGANAQNFEAVWNQVSKFNLYDPLALLAATPGADALLFRAEVPAGAGANVQIIGRNSIKDPTLMKDLLAGLEIESLNSPLPLKSRTGTPHGYPTRQHVEESAADWAKPLSGYDPPEYTAEVVLKHEGEWADPPDVNQVDRRFVTQTPHGEAAVQLDGSGRPLNPLGRTGLRGRGLLGRWGRNPAGDALLTRVDPQTGRLQLLVIKRKDSNETALPGGMVDKGEEIADTVARELFEETGAKLSFEHAATIFRGLVDDPRNTDNAWMETTALHKHLSPAEQAALPLKAGDDAGSVHWTDVNQGLLSSMYASHADYVRLALLELKKNPAIAGKVDAILGNASGTK